MISILAVLVTIQHRVRDHPVSSSAVQLVSSTRRPMQYAVAPYHLCVCHFRRVPHFAKCLVTRVVYSNNQDKRKKPPSPPFPLTPNIGGPCPGPYLHIIKQHSFVVPASPGDPLLLERAVLPDACLHVSRPCGEEVPSWTWRHRDDRILVALQHHLSISSVWIPKLYSSIFRSRHDPRSIWCQAHAEHVVLVHVSKRCPERYMCWGGESYLVSFESSDAFATAGNAAVGQQAPLRGEFPHLDRLVQTATDQLTSTG